MGRPVGSPKTPGSGRQKGTPNKDKFDAQAIAAELGIDPLKILLQLAAGDYKALGYKEEQRVVAITEGGDVLDYTIPVPVRQKAAKDAAEFLFPKYKTVEFKGDAANAAAASITQVMALAAALQKEKDASRDAAGPQPGPADKGAGN